MVIVQMRRRDGKRATHFVPLIRIWGSTGRGIIRLVWTGPLVVRRVNDMVVSESIVLRATVQVMVAVMVGDVLRLIKMRNVSVETLAVCNMLASLGRRASRLLEGLPCVSLRWSVAALRFAPFGHLQGSATTRFYRMERVVPGLSVADKVTDDPDGRSLRRGRILTGYRSLVDPDGGRTCRLVGRICQLLFTDGSRLQVGVRLARVGLLYILILLKTLILFDEVLGTVSCGTPPCREENNKITKSTTGSGLTHHAVSYNVAQSDAH